MYRSYQRATIPWSPKTTSLRTVHACCIASQCLQNSTISTLVGVGSSALWRVSPLAPQDLARHVLPKNITVLMNADTGRDSLLPAIRPLSVSRTSMAYSLILFNQTIQLRLQGQQSPVLCHKWWCLTNEHPSFLCHLPRCRWVAAHAVKQFVSRRRLTF